MPKVLILIVISLLSACANNSHKADVLKQGFGESFEDDGIIFLDGPWFAPGTDYGYQIIDGQLRVAHATEFGGVEIHVFTIDTCAGLDEGIENLKRAAFESAEIALGIARVSEGLPEVIVMDGPSYTLTIHSDAMWGSITLEGGGTTQYIVPWVDAAFKIGEIAESCDDALKMMH